MRTYPLLTALLERRSRRFGLGMRIPSGPLAYQSRHKPVPLSEDEEAALEVLADYLSEVFPHCDDAAAGAAAAALDGSPVPLPRSLTWPLIR